MQVTYEHSLSYKLIEDSKKKKLKLSRKKLYKDGVHYTPDYISNNLSKVSIERAIKNKKCSPMDLKCFDLACGSGSFLSSIYDNLYRLNMKQNTDLVIGDGKSVLSLKQRKKIIESCIFGIDIDLYAVEISKLVLILKFFEDFPTESKNARCKEVPNLEDNVIFADSLIDSSQKIKAPKATFGINKSHKKIYNLVVNKKIDVIVGNPPYIKIQDLNKIEGFPVNHYKSIYKETLSTGSIDFSTAFIQRATEIISRNGVVGFIIPNKLFKNNHGIGLRKFLTNNEELSLFQFVDFNSCQIFDASIYTCLLNIEKKEEEKKSRKSVKKAGTEKFKCAQVYSLEDPINTLIEISNTDTRSPDKLFEIGLIDLFSIDEKPWNLNVGPRRELLSKLNSKFSKLEETVIDKKIFQGIPTGSDKVFTLEKIKAKNSKVWLMRSEKLGDWEIEKQYLKPIYRGSSDLKAFSKQFAESYLLYPYDNEGVLLNSKEFKESLAYEYLSQEENKKGIKDEKGKTVLFGLDEREGGKYSGKSFYQYSYPKNMNLWAKDKIMIPYLAEKFNAHYDDKGHTFVNVSTGGYCILAPENVNERVFALAILNSNVFDFLIKSFSGDFRGGWIECSKSYIGAAPVPSFKNNLEDEEIIQIQGCLDDLYEHSKYYYSNSDQDEADTAQKLSRFYNDLDWLNTWAKDQYELTDDEYRLVEFYTTDISDLDENDIIEIQKLYADKRKEEEKRKQLLLAN